MNSTSLTLETVTPQLDKNDTLRGWQLSDRLDWAMGLPVSPPARFVAVAIVKHTGAETRLASRIAREHRGEYADAQQQGKPRLSCVWPRSDNGREL